MSDTQISSLPVRSEQNAILVPSGENWGQVSTRVEAINFVAERLGSVAVGTSICQILMVCDRCSVREPVSPACNSWIRRVVAAHCQSFWCPARSRDSPETAARFGSAAAGAGRKHQLAPVGSPGEAFTKRRRLVSQTRRLPAGNRDEKDTTRGAEPVEGHRATVGRDGGSTVTSRSRGRRREPPLFQTLYGRQENAEGGLRLVPFRKRQQSSVWRPTRSRRPLVLRDLPTRFCARDHRARE